METPDSFKVGPWFFERDGFNLFVCSENEIVAGGDNCYDQDWQEFWEAVKHIAETPET